jgi:hypothetical protein
MADAGRDKSLIHDHQAINPLTATTPQDEQNSTLMED